MRSTLSSKLAAAGGIAYVVLLTIGDDVIAKGEGPDLDASRAEIADFVADHYDKTQFLIGRGIGLLGVAMLIPFFLVLRQRLRGENGDAGLLPDLMLAGGAFAAVTQALAFAPHVAGHVMLESGGLSPDVAAALYTTASGFFVLSWAGLALALTCVAAAAIPAGDLPRALTWTAPPLAAGLLVGLVTLPGAAGFMAFFLCFIWLIGASIALLVGGRSPREAKARGGMAKGLAGATIATALAVGLIAGGCGGDDDGGDSSLAKQQWIAQADAICAGGAKEIDRQASQTFGGEEPQPAEIERFAEQVAIPTIEREIAQVKALGVPEGDADEIEAIITAAQTGVAQAKENPLALDQGALNEATRQMASYGAKVCGQNG